MIKRILVAAVAAAFVAAPFTLPTAAIAAKATAEKSEKKTEKKTTPQQQKMKDCSSKWQVEKKAKSVSGRAAHRKFMSECLKA